MPDIRGSLSRCDDGGGAPGSVPGRMCVGTTIALPRGAAGDGTSGRTGAMLGAFVRGASVGGFIRGEVPAAVGRGGGVLMLARVMPGSGLPCGEGLAIGPGVGGGELGGFERGASGGGELGVFVRAAPGCGRLIGVVNGGGELGGFERGGVPSTAILGAVIAPVGGGGIPGKRGDELGAFVRGNGFTGGDSSGGFVRANGLIVGSLAGFVLANGLTGSSLGGRGRRRELSRGALSMPSGWRMRGELSTSSGRMRGALSRPSTAARILRWLPGTASGDGVMRGI
jgi:hypothetical protein